MENILLNFSKVLDAFLLNGQKRIITDCSFFLRAVVMGIPKSNYQKLNKPRKEACSNALTRTRLGGLKKINLEASKKA